MKRILPIGIAMALTLAQAPTFTQGKKPPEIATDIPAADVQSVLNAPSTIADRLITAVDMGSYNVGVGVLRRGPTRPGAPVGAIEHDQITEVYYIISGTGTLLTGGTVNNPTPAAPDSEIVTTVVGPSKQGTFKEPAQRRKVGPGDVIIIPPGVYHGFDEVASGIDYLAVRPDPNKVLPAGYLHPALRGKK
jgi:mannose-6-phosphate isomerase-like protein (cupin superfamily)